MAATRYLYGPDDHETLLTGGLGVLLLVGAPVSDGVFSLVEHPLAPRALGSLVHTHRNEDEYSLVLEGTIRVEIAGETLQANARSVVVKPRGIPHAFWNPTDKPARLLEVIVPRSQTGEYVGPVQLGDEGAAENDRRCSGTPGLGR